MTATRAYWQHAKSGDIYAVLLNVDNALRGITGPLSQREATTANLDDFDYDTEDVEWASSQEFRDYIPEDDKP